MTIYGLDGNHKAHAQTPYTPLNNVYLCGEIREINKFDLVGCDSKLEVLLLRKHDITHAVTIVTCNGKLFAGKLYWWHDTDNRQHGLVCRSDDKTANKHAATCYNARHSRLEDIIL